jgi:hypothetical protein
VTGSTHLESVDGFRSAGIYAEMYQGGVYLEGVEHDIDTASVGGLGNNLLLIEAVATGPNGPIMTIERFSKWGAASSGPQAGKIFSNTDCRWELRGGYDLIPGSIPGWFTGTVPTYNANTVVGQPKNYYTYR